MKNKDIKRLINGLLHLKNRLIDSYNNIDIMFEQYEEDRLDVGNAIDLIQNQQAEIERLKNSFEAIGIVDIRAKIDTFEGYENQIKELEFINEQKDLIISKLKKENAELKERIGWYSFGRNGHLGHIDTSDLL